MRSLNRSFIRLLKFTTRRRGDDRLREEMESHIAFQTEENIRRGMSSAEARRDARLKFGAVDALRESYHSEEGLPFVESVLLDVRYAFRVLRKTPAFTIVAVVTLMLGIGANIVVFGMLNAVLMHPLDVRDPQSLYQIRHQQWMMGRLLTTSYPAFEDYQQRNTTFSGMVGINGYSHAQLSWRNKVISVSGDEVTGNYFDLLGVQPATGRFFHTADEHGPNSAPYVVLSDALWRREFQADPGIVGMTIELDHRPFTVVVLADFIPNEERVLIIEDTAELHIRKPHVISAEAQLGTHKSAITFDIVYRSLWFVCFRRSFLSPGQMYISLFGS